jgi:hypothetical protein
MAFYERQDLEIPPRLSFILRSLEAVAQSSRGGPELLENHLSEMMRLTATSSLSIGMSAVTSSLKCPYGSPPADIQAAFDSSRNLHLECLHSSPKHCWDLSGNNRTC